MANYHVSKNKTIGLWGAMREGASQVAGYYDTQAKAERAAKNLCHNSGGGEVRIYGLDGKIRDSDTLPPGHDPNPPKDKRH